ncbi:MAG: MoaD/ThiS family protein [Deltaproteobacteria bacterium]|nr:MoaD/ThiS family protein [Deltaproteobacteria bacterium]
MVIRFFGPFEQQAGREVRIRLEKPISARETLQILASRYPGFARFLEAEDDARLSAHLMLVRNGVPLRLADMVDDKDCIDILLPVTGG